MNVNEPRVIIVGAGIGGLVLALALDEAGIPSRIFESATEVHPLGVGINILPHASQVLCRLGLEEALSEVGVHTEESAFFNRFGQLIHREPSGRFGGYPDPQFSIHRGDLQGVLLRAVRDRLGEDSVITDHQCTGTSTEGDSVVVDFRSTSSGQAMPPETADVVIACDGLHSALRKQFYPDEGAPRYSGITMWRGVTPMQPFLTGATMARAGWLATGKLVVYPIRNDIDAAGNQLINWVAEIESPIEVDRDWELTGNIEDFIGHFADWNFEWLDVPAMFGQTESVLKYPMVDQEPLDRWTFGRVTLLGDAAHPMVPRGSNGAGQAILDAAELARCLANFADPAAALQAYEDSRRPATSAVVHENHRNPPDAILREVWERTGDQPFDDINDVISPTELTEITDRYKAVAGIVPANLAKTYNDRRIV